MFQICKRTLHNDRNEASGNGSVNINCAYKQIFGNYNPCFIISAVLRKEYILWTINYYDNGEELVFL